MLALSRSGRQAQALESYREGRELLVEELGLEPSPLLRGVHASILRQEPFAVDRGAIPEVEHFEEVAAALLGGKVTVVVGSDSEPLASELARRFGVEAATPELARVSQAVAVLNGAGPLYDALHALVDGDGEPSAVHRFLARLPAVLRERETTQPLLVTTGYELALERALEEVEEPYETVCYLASGQMRGSFCHIAPSGVANVIERPNAYTGELALDGRTVLLHLQGRMDPATGLASRLTVLYGPSGVGKSSLLGAGVARRLRGQSGAPVVVHDAWAEDPVARLVASVHAECGELGATAGLVDAVAAGAQRSG